MRALPWLVEPHDGWPGTEHPHTGRMTGDREPSPGWTEAQKAAVDRLCTECLTLSETVGTHQVAQSVRVARSRRAGGAGTGGKEERQPGPRCAFWAEARPPFEALSVMGAIIPEAGVSPLILNSGVARMDTWQALSASVEERLAAMSSGERGVFAAGAAERLMGWHEALPEEERASFTMSLRPLLNSVCEATLGDSTAFTAVKRGVAEYMLSEYCHNDGQDGPDDADEHAAAATLYAAHAYLFECRDFAVWASRRAVDAVDEHLQYLAEQGEDIPDLDEATVAELQRQLRDLDLIAKYSKDLRFAGLGLPIDTSIRLRVELRTPLPSRD